MDQIPTPEFCCDQCAKNPKCSSWTWVEDAGLTLPGSPSQCWLKGGLPTGKVPKDGVISGIPGAENPHQDDLLVQERWGQCGGKFWEGPKRCRAAWACKERSEWYHQCLPRGEASKLQGEIPNNYVHQSVAAAFGGPGVKADDLCPQITTTATATSTTLTHTVTVTETRTLTTSAAAIDREETPAAIIRTAVSSSAAAAAATETVLPVAAAAGSAMRPAAAASFDRGVAAVVATTTAALVPTA